MSDSALPPEQWRPLFKKIGVDFGYRPLATHMDMDHTRLRRLILGGGTSEDAIRRVADTFRVPPSKIRELRGEPAGALEPFTLPDDAGRLTHDERDVIRAMVRALLRARGDHAMESAPQSDASSEGDEGQKTNVVRRDDWGTAAPPAGGESERRAAAKRKPSERRPKPK